VRGRGGAGAGGWAPQWAWTRLAARRPAWCRGGVGAATTRGWPATGPAVAAQMGAAHQSRATDQGGGQAARRARPRTRRRRRGAVRRRSGGWRTRSGGACMPTHTPQPPRGRGTASALSVKGGAAARREPTTASWCRVAAAEAPARHVGAAAVRAGAAPTQRARRPPHRPPHTPAAPPLPYHGDAGGARRLPANGRAAAAAGGAAAGGRRRPRRRR